MVVLSTDTSSPPHTQAVTVQGAARVPDLKRARKERDKAYAELGQRLDRAGKMRRVLDRMAVEKTVMTVSKRCVIGCVQSSMRSFVFFGGVLAPYFIILRLMCLSHDRPSCQ